MLKDLKFDIFGCEKIWKPLEMDEDEIANIRQTILEGKVSYWNSLADLYKYSHESIEEIFYAFENMPKDLPKEKQVLTMELRNINNFDYSKIMAVFIMDMLRLYFCVEIECRLVMGAFYVVCLKIRKVFFNLGEI